MLKMVKMLTISFKVSQSRGRSSEVTAPMCCRKICDNVVMLATRSKMFR